MTERPVKFPEMRLNLVCAVAYLAHSVERPLIHEKVGDKTVAYYDLDMAIHQIYDDMGDMPKDPHAEIGYFFEDAREADAVLELVRTLDTVLDADPPIYEIDDFMRTPAWAPVVEAARRALAALDDEAAPRPTQ